MIFPSLSSSATFDLPPTRYSIGSGVNNSIRQLGSVFGIAFAVLRVGTESANAVPGFTALYSGLTTAAVITALLGAFVRTAPVQKRTPSPAVVSDSVIRASGQKASFNPNNQIELSVYIIEQHE